MQQHPWSLPSRRQEHPSPSGDHPKCLPTWGPPLRTPAVAGPARGFVQTLVTPPCALGTAPVPTCSVPGPTQHPAPVPRRGAQASTPRFTSGAAGAPSPSAAPHRPAQPPSDSRALGAGKTTQHLAENHTLILLLSPALSSAWHLYPCGTAKEKVFGVGTDPWFKRLWCTCYSQTGQYNSKRNTVHGSWDQSKTDI